MYAHIFPYHWVSDPTFWLVKEIRRTIHRRCKWPATGRESVGIDHLGSTRSVLINKKKTTINT